MITFMPAVLFLAWITLGGWAIDTVQARLAYTLKPVSFLPRGVLAAQGDKVEHLFLVTSGEVTCARRLAHDGKKGLGKQPCCQTGQGQTMQCPEMHHQPVLGSLLG